MSQFAERKKELISTKKLERELNLKQLQINSLLSITQAINDNVKAPELFAMYKSFLTWEMEVKKMALFILQEGIWICVTHQGISGNYIPKSAGEKLLQFEKLQSLKDEKVPFFKDFDVVIPVKHKKEPIAYTFIGGFEENDDMYNKIQFITTITNIIAVAIENKRLFKRQLEQERLKREMELASEMQHMLIPATLPQTDCFELASIYKPKLGVGGDYFDFIGLDEDNFVFCIADISGKGVAAALLMANFQANFHTLIRKNDPLEIFIDQLNQSLYRITGGDKFLTLFVAKYNTKSNQLSYINAGHNPPFLVMNDVCIELDKGCAILGGLSSLPEIEVGKETLQENALICTFTDGLTDTQNTNGDYFTQKMMKEFVQSHAQLDVQKFNDKLFQTVENFKDENQEYPDDFTVLTCKISA